MQHDQHVGICGQQRLGADLEDPLGRACKDVLDAQGVQLRGDHARRAVGVQRPAAHGGVEHRCGRGPELLRRAGHGLDPLPQRGGEGLRLLATVEDPPAGRDLLVEGLEARAVVVGGAVDVLHDHLRAGVGQRLAGHPVGQSEDDVGLLGDDQLLGDLQVAGGVDVLGQRRDLLDPCGEVLVVAAGRKAPARDHPVQHPMPSSVVTGADSSSTTRSGGASKRSLASQFAISSGSRPRRRPCRHRRRRPRHRPSLGLRCMRW